MTQTSVTAHKIMNQQIDDTFKNSPSTKDALQRLATQIPLKVIRTIVATALKIYTKMLELHSKKEMRLF